MSKFTYRFTHETRSGKEFTIRLIGKAEVCSNCEGSGKIVNPSIDGHGLTREDFDDDPDFAEAYFAGRYDIDCPDCNGDRVVIVPNEERLNKRQRFLLERHYETLASLRESYRMEMMERRYGA